MVPSVYNLQDKQNGRILRTMTYKHSWLDVLLQLLHDLLTQHVEATTAPVSVPDMNGTGFINVQLVRPEITAMAFIGCNCRPMRTVICLGRQHKHRNVTLFCPLVMDYEHSGFDDLPGTLSH